MSEERKFELRNENFVVVHGWMRNNLKLSGNELTVYAIIYQFSQEKNSWCYASQEYLAEWIGSTTRTVKTIIASLLSKKLIAKKVCTDNEGRFNVYKAYTTPLVDSENISLPPSGKNFTGVGKNFHGGGENFSQNTIYEIKEEIKEENKESANAPAPQKTSRFSKPSISEIAAYCSEKNISIDPASFYYFYESKGWKVGNAPMKNWKAAIQTWVKRSRNGYGNSYSVKPNSCGHNNPEGFDEL